MRLPLPHSHGIAIQVRTRRRQLRVVKTSRAHSSPRHPFIQYIDDPDIPASNPNYVEGIDIDTCDQATNPQCLLTGNYPAVPNAGATQENLARINQCIMYPDTDYCRPKTTPVTDNAEVIAYYDGAQPAFALYDERNPYSGINISFVGETAFSSDPFPCGGIDPATGLAPLRSLNIHLACDPSTNLTVGAYDEVGVCQFFITGRSAFACGTMPPPPPAR